MDGGGLSKTNPEVWLTIMQMTGESPWIGKTFVEAQLNNIDDSQ